MKISKNFIFKQFFLYDGANYRPPNLNFWTFAVIYFQKLIANFQKKKQLDAIETGKCWRLTKVGKISKIFIFKPFFLYDWSKYRPPNLGFRTLVVIYFKSIRAVFQKNHLHASVVIYFKSIRAVFQKNHLHASETGKIWKQTKVVKKTKKNFWTIFSIRWSKLSTTQPKFLNSCCNLLSKNYWKFSKKIVGCNWNWKVLKADKSSENIKNFYF